MSNIVYIIGDDNGVIYQDDGVFTTELKDAKTFKTIGDAMRVCSELNKNVYTFSVRSYNPEAMG